LFVAIIYIVMNISILGVIPWREFAGTANTPAQRYVIASFMERLYGTKAGVIATVLIMWTAFASVFSLLLVTRVYRLPLRVTATIFEFSRASIRAIAFLMFLCW
jgi:amino acid transporter